MEKMINHFLTTNSVESLSMGMQKERICDMTSIFDVLKMPDNKITVTQNYRVKRIIKYIDIADKMNKRIQGDPLNRYNVCLSYVVAINANNHVLNLLGKIEYTPKISKQETKDMINNRIDEMHNNMNWYLNVP